MLFFRMTNVIGIYSEKIKKWPEHMEKRYHVSLRSDHLFDYKGNESPSIKLV